MPSKCLRTVCGVVVLLGGGLLVAGPVRGQENHHGTDGENTSERPPEDVPPLVESRELPSPAVVGHHAARVLIISEDGLRPDLVASMHLPWHEALYHHGAYSWKARTIRTASTLPAHAAMLSGVDVKIHGLTWNNWRP